jgi:hypothetical protein
VFSKHGADALFSACQKKEAWQGENEKDKQN